MYWYTYVLESKIDKKFYIGITHNVKYRIKRHNKGEVLSTKNRKPFNLVYCEICLNQRDAIKREKYFKTGFGRRFLKNRLENYYKNE